MTDDPKLTPELKSQWLAALRSGKYSQGRGALQKDDCFCCLGVLCDLVSPSGWSPPDSKGIVEFEFEGEAMTGSLPITMNRKYLRVSIENELIRMNDDEKASFTQIADYIEANV